MPSFKVLCWLAGASWTVTTALLIVSQAGVHIGSFLFAYCLCVAGTLTVVASVTYLCLVAIAPVREAFMHGFQLAIQQMAAAQRANQPGTDLARVLRPPAGAWTVNEQRPAPVAVVGDERAASQHRAKFPWRG